MSKIECQQCGHIQTMTVLGEDPVCEHCGGLEFQLASGRVID